MAFNFHDERSTQPISRASVAATTVGNNTLVAAVTGKKIRVLAFFGSLSGTTPTAAFQSGAGGTALSGTMVPTTGSILTLPYNPLGWFETAAGALLNVALAGTAPSLQGTVIYALIDDDRREY